MTLPAFGFMLASPSTPTGGRAGVSLDQLAASGDYLFQRKLDGIRVQLRWDGTKVQLLSRHGSDLTARFPEVVDLHRQLLLTRDTPLILDGELVMDDPARNLGDLMRRVKTEQPSLVRRLSEELPAVFVAFDILWTYMGNLSEHPLDERLSALAGLQGATGIPALSSTFDGVQLMEQARANRWEGIMAKRKNSRYQQDTRSWSWLKFKITHTVRAIAYGASGQRGLGSKLAMLDGGMVRDVGSVGSGFRVHDQEFLQDSWSQGGYPVVLIDCLGISTSGRLRQPVFKGFTVDPMTAADFQQTTELPVST